ncbi:MAG: ABC transporter ATP-binding protein/permease [Bacilli bacterium]|nr:ABC transporter ATP-binding protein/permease [Bacilli bacterium]
MLKLDNITKVYATKDMKVEALKGISLAFRKSEFVSILGPSGCGKTTALNIIGGLDHYTSGDLVISGVSTKKFNDRDWDVYRNHRIGFIFQSYNLIPHQNIEENVELALTIAGVSKEERVAKAREALDKVGLKGMYTKKPNQLSGGQCQRVAIARALVNEPDILLADEPTGALDSETSVQIMDLIKEISKEKLVIMVTHNPEIAEKYSTRIIRLLDGKVVGDSNPYTFEEEAKENEEKSEKTAQEVAKEKAKMSWFTAFRLSTKNLLSKGKRTALIAVASSIGIVGVSAVLAVSQGVTGYIQSMQDDMLSGNPIQIAQTGMDLSSFVGGGANGSTNNAKVVFDSYKNGMIDVQFMSETLVKRSNSVQNAMISNKIDEDYVQFIHDMPKDYYAAIMEDYGINVKNNFYTHADVSLSGYSKSELATQRYSITAITNFCKTILSNVNNGEYKSYASMVDSYTDSIGQILDDNRYILNQYDVLKGKLPEKEDEMVIVLNHNNALSEFTLTLLGYYSQDEFANAIYKFSEQNDKFSPELWEKQSKISFDDLMAKTYTYYPNNSVLTKVEASLLDQRTFDYHYMASSSMANALEMKVVGILTPKETVRYGSLDSGLYFTKAFVDKYIKDNKNSEIAQYIHEKTDGTDADSIASYYGTMELDNGTSVPINSGITYSYSIDFPDGIGSSTVNTYEGVALYGSENSLSGLVDLLGGSFGGNTGSEGPKTSLRTATLSLHDVGGSDIPTRISIYPRSFDDKYMVTDYLDKWEAEGSLTLSNGKVLQKDSRTEIRYTDNLAIIISIINDVIQMITVALIAFTALSLVVSTVMIGIITYVSVMERVKEIGVIRSLGGRKRDVSHLFNAETLIIGALSGGFGLALTYLLELILNLTVGVTFNLGMIANLNWISAVIVFAISILLTMFAGIVPARAAAKQDPVVALRTE